MAIADIIICSSEASPLFCPPWRLARGSAMSALPLRADMLSVAHRCLLSANNGHKRRRMWFYVGVYEAWSRATTVPTRNWG